jgi:hypothetical protein
VAVHYGSDVWSYSIDFGVYETFQIERLRGSSDLLAIEIKLNDMVG